MDSRIIYESNAIYESTIKWNRAENSESEWIYFDLQKHETIKNLITDFFISDRLHVSIGRKDSFTSDKNTVYSKIESLIGKTNFKIWNEDFTLAIEISNVGVYRTGKKS